MSRTAAKKRKSKKPATKNRKEKRAPTSRWRLALRWMTRGALAVAVLLVLWIALYRFVNPPITPYMLAERYRHGELHKDWVDLEDIAPAMARSVVAAEDANFCLHWGFDMEAIRDALEEGANRGASTISQQVVKNTFLWHGRSWPRKALEALMTPLMEALWPKRRIIEVYLNVIEFDKGVFGVGAASKWYFGVDAADLSNRQAAALAVVLPDPKGRSAKKPTKFLQSRARRAADGAATIKQDGRSACFDSQG